MRSFRSNFRGKWSQIDRNRQRSRAIRTNQQLLVDSLRCSVLSVRTRIIGCKVLTRVRTTLFPTPLFSGCVFVSHLRFLLFSSLLFFCVRPFVELIEISDGSIQRRLHSRRFSIPVKPSRTRVRPVANRKLVCA